MNLSRALAFTGPFEGRVSHMYLDTEGYVTVGVGNMLPTPQTAIALVWKKHDGSEPNEVEISDEWYRIHSAQPALAANAYRGMSTMDLLDGEIDRLFAKRAFEFGDALERLFPLFPDWPEEAQTATLDMAFNLGSAAIPRHWPRLTDALRTMNWRVAADESTRPQARPARNDAVRALYMAAASAGAIPEAERA